MSEESLQKRTLNGVIAKLKTAKLQGLETGQPPQQTEGPGSGRETAGPRNWPAHKAETIKDLHCCRKFWGKFEC